MNARIFFVELKQRNVYKVAIAYAVVAWLLMQVASQIFPFFEIPNWAVRLVVLLLITGFPVALILAWAFDLTPEGIKRADDVSPSKSIMPQSRNANVHGKGAQRRGVSFTTTHWSVLLEAQGSTREARAAMDKLCRTYWPPVYGFVRQRGIEPEQAKDFTQGFFALLLEHRNLDTVRKEKGRLRSYLLRLLNHFLTSERCRAMAIKHGEGQRLIPLEQLSECERVGFEPTGKLTADQIYEQRWALTLLDQVLARLRKEYRSAGPASAGLFDRLQGSLTNGSDCPLQKDTAHEFGTTENEVKEAFHRLRRRYRQLLREEIAQTVVLPGEIEDELRHLIAVLRAYPIGCHSHAMDCDSS